MAPQTPEKTNTETRAPGDPRRGNGGLDPLDPSLTTRPDLFIEKSSE